METTWRLFIKSKTLIYLTSLFLLTLNFKSGEGQLQVLNESADYDGRASNFNCIRCLVSGSGDKIYRWYHNGNLINSRYNLSFVSFNENTLVVDKHTVDLRYEGKYQLFVSSPFGRIFCGKIDVKFKVDGSFIGGQSQPDIRQVVVGRPYSLQCPKHSYTRGCVYKWGGHSHSTGVKHMRDFKHRVVLPNGTLFFSAVDDTDIIDFGLMGGGHGCILDCFFPSFHGMARSHKINFNKTGVNASRFGPTIVTAIKDRVVRLGTDYVKVTCAAAGSPTPSYRWVRIDDENNEVDITNTKDIDFGDFNHTMAIQNVDIHHNGTYACIATIDAKRDMVQWKLIVKVAPVWLPDVKIEDKVVDVFTNLTWECRATGDPVPRYTWYGNASKMDTRSERHRINGGKISFSRVHVEDTGMYQCVAENDFGFIYQTVSLHVRARKPTFNISSSIVVFLKNSHATLTCQANAIPRANYTWSRNGLSLLPSTKYQYVNDGELLVINEKVTYEDEGVYKCTAVNAFGKAEKVINVTTEHITFLKKPESNYNISRGSSFVLQCEVESSQEFYYKWRLNGRELQYDDTHILEKSGNKLVKLNIKNANEIDNGRYECVAYITKPAPAEKSARADIFITGPPNALRGFHLKQRCNNFTAILRWDSLVGYYNINEISVIIEWQSTYDTSDRWYRVSERINATLGQAKVEKLSPWAKFRFRGITQNKYGDGPPSNTTKYKNCETSPTRPDKCPKILETRNVEDEGSGVMTIKWKAMTDIDFNGPGFNYVVKYKRRNDSRWNHTVVKRSENKFTLPNVPASQTLVFMLQANNSQGLGPSCLESNVSDPKSKPGLISEVKIKEIGSSMVLITWHVENSDIANINGYKLEYGEVGTMTNRKKRSEYRDNCTDISTNPCSTVFILHQQSTNEYRLDGLSATTQYNISIRAYNNIGNGPPTYFTFKTDSPGFSQIVDSPMYKKDWFITVISMIVLLMFIIVLIIVVLNLKRSNRYKVGERERMRGGFHNMHDLHDPQPFISPFKDRATSLKSGVHVSDGSTLAGDEEVSLAMSTEDKYDDDESFVGEYSDKGSTKKFEEMFV
ncbi:contactin-3-like [Dendronephthya gigantea]|uniref:contactin-3-like n=1 Tax=Dendronephthya gigantea TaxID=151771 RepID=UPI001069D43D|nr:contactin-3-like [Dendronephthya gigantea]XP_028404881.1 contactin-3-like [Dendronephthya gigantea]